MTTQLLPKLIVSDPHNVHAARPYQGLHAVSPILIGFATPFVLLMLLAPRTFLDLGALAFAVVVLVMLTALTIFVHGLLNRGQIAAIAFDPWTRTVEIVETGLFARSVTKLPFGDIADYRAVDTYDREGNRYPKSQLVLRTAETILLPLVPTADQLEVVREMLLY